MFVVPLLLIIVFQLNLKTALPEHEDEDTQLLLVQVLFRHGARTTYKTYPNDPYANETYYPYGWGGLTNKGKMDAFLLGKFLRKHYNDFLGEDYTDDLVYIRSTDRLRTKMSALLVLAGLFPPSQALLWNQDLMWQPIPVSYKDADVEDLLHTRICDFKIKLFKAYLNDQNIVKEFIQPYESVFDKVKEHSGKYIRHPIDMQELYFVLKTQFEMNYTLPEWTKEVFPETLEAISALSYEFHNYDAEAKKLNTGYLLKKIITDSKQKIENKIQPKERRLFLYSGHDTTIGYMLNSLLDIRQTKIPAYASALSFELHKRNDDFFIKVRYRESTGADEFTDVKLPKCDILCPLEKFESSYSWLLPTLSMDDACKREVDYVNPTVS